MSINMLGNKRALGHKHTEESKEKMSLCHKGQTPWNKGMIAWNNGLEWPDEVKENISKGMILYWQQQRQHNLK